MKKLVFLVSLFSLYSSMMANGIYLWEYFGNGQRSCCLHLGNQDICNPNAACTRNIPIDLLGINDYLTRVLNMEKIGTFPYAKFLNDAQGYIRRMASVGSGLSYRFDEYRSSMKFFHDLALEYASSKTDKKSSGTTSTMTEAEKNKQKQEEVFEYLVKIGLASRFKK